MFCTEGFGVGIDAPNVRTVVVVGSSRSLIDFWQVAGRRGRDDAACTMDILYHACQLIAAGADDRYDPACGAHRYGDFQWWAEMKRPKCRRVELEIYISGQRLYTCKESKEKDGIESALCCNLCLD